MDRISNLCRSLGYWLFGRCWGTCGGRRVLLHTPRQRLACEAGPSAVILVHEPTPAREAPASLG
jgi:hypothetical protein